MSDPIDGGPAFPHLDYLENVPNGNTIAHMTPGMSLRDWLAGQALAGMLASDRDAPKIEGCNAAQAMAEVAYSIADALIAAREKGPEA